MGLEGKATTATGERPPNQIKWRSKQLSDSLLSPIQDINRVAEIAILIPLFSDFLQNMLT